MFYLDLGVYKITYVYKFSNYIRVRVMKEMCARSYFYQDILRKFKSKRFFKRLLLESLTKTISKNPKWYTIRTPPMNIHIVHKQFWRDLANLPDRFISVRGLEVLYLQKTGFLL